MYDTTFSQVFLSSDVNTTRYVSVQISNGFPTKGLPKSLSALCCEKASSYMSNLLSVSSV